MIGRRVVLVLEEPLHADHRGTVYRDGDCGTVVGTHPRWNALLVWIDGTARAAMFFPDEIEEAT